MSVTVDREPLAVDRLGLHTVGDVLAHVQKDRRLVVQVLIDGQEPPAAQINAIRQTDLANHAIYIETADPRQLALEVLDEVTSQLTQADKAKAQVADFLQRSQTAAAMEQLGFCVRAWQHGQESVVKVAELLRIQLDSVQVAGRSLQQVMEEIAGQLRQIRDALGQHDYVSLSDVLLYETASAEDWQASLQALRDLIASIK